VITKRFICFVYLFLLGISVVLVFGMTGSLVFVGLICVCCLGCMFLELRRFNNKQNNCERVGIVQYITVDSVADFRLIIDGVVYLCCKMVFPDVVVGDKVVFNWIKQGVNCRIIKISKIINGDGL